MVRLADGRDLPRAARRRHARRRRPRRRPPPSSPPSTPSNRLAPDEAELARPDSFFEVVNQNFQSTEEGVPELFPASVHAGLHRRIAERTQRHARRRRAPRRRRPDGQRARRRAPRARHPLRRARCTASTASSSPTSSATSIRSATWPSSPWTSPSGAAGTSRAASRRPTCESAHENREEAALLLPLYRSYRAHVRAKVDHITARSPEVDADVRAAKMLGARRFLALAWTYARADETPPLIVMRGASGTGKSVLATALAPWLGAEVVRSDVVRKELAGLAPTDRLDAAGNDALYAHGHVRSAPTAALLERAEARLRAGRAVVLDATYLRRDSARRGPGARRAARRAVRDRRRRRATRTSCASASARARPPAPTRAMPAVEVFEAQLQRRGAARRRRGRARCPRRVRGSHPSWR